MENIKQDLLKAQDDITAEIDFVVKGMHVLYATCVSNIN